MGAIRLPRGTNHTFAAKPVDLFGCHFRSTLEARWAIVFTELGWPWEYEPRFFRTSEGGYLPDFRAGLGKRCWYEIKGPEPVQRDYVRAREVVKQTKAKFRFLVGPLPGQRTGGILRTRVLRGGVWYGADWDTGAGAKLDVALQKALSARFP